MGPLLLCGLSHHDYQQLNWSQILGQHCSTALTFAIWNEMTMCLWQNQSEGARFNAMVTIKCHQHSLISSRASSGKWTFYFPGLVRILPPISQSWWGANTYWAGNTEKSISSWNSRGWAKDFFFLATLDHLCFLFLWEHYIKPSLLRGSFRLLNHGLFFPQDITCYFGEGFQKVLSDLAWNWFCIKGKNRCPRVSISTSTNRRLTSPRGCQQ